MIINGTIFNVELIDVLTELKNELYANGIQRFAKMFDSGEDVMICCPYHKDGQERRPSAGIRKSDGTFHCLACGETKSLCEMISDCLGYNDPFGREGYKWLAKNFLSIQVEERDDIGLDFDREYSSGGRNNSVCDFSCLYVSEGELDRYRYNHPYMYQRGLTQEVIDFFDIGYDKQTDSITFPVRDMNGNCMFVARRAVKTKYFDIPKGVEKPLYGLYEVMQKVQIPRGASRYTTLIPDNVYICEGLFDCLRLWCNGKYAVAGFGCLFNSYQIKQIQDLPGRTIVLALDNDDAGRKANERLRKCITNKIIKEVVLPDNRKDIGECTDKEIQNLKEIF